MEETPSFEIQGPIIGADLPWDRVKGHFLRVVQYAAVAAREQGHDAVGRPNVKAPGGLAYAMLLVESPVIAASALMPVKHREDFRAIASIFEDRGVATDEEVLVVYHPLKYPWYLRLSSRFMPVLSMFVYQRGSLEKLYNLATDEWPPSPFWEHRLADRFRGRFGYE